MTLIKQTDSRNTLFFCSTESRVSVITRYHWEGNNRRENKLVYCLSQHTVFKDSWCWQESFWDCLGGQVWVGCAGAWVSLFLCTDLLQTTEVNQQSLFALSLSSQLSVQSSGLIWWEYWQSVCSLIGFGGVIHTDVSVVPMWIRFLEEPRQAKAIRSFFKWALGSGNDFQKVKWSLILTKTLTLDETAQAFYQWFHELSSFNIFLSRCSKGSSNLNSNCC